MNHRLVEPTLFARNEMGLELALASKITKEILMKDAVLNVFSALTVQPIEHVLEINVKTLAQEFVDSLRSVRLLIMFQHVRAIWDILEILSPSAEFLHLKVRINMIIFVQLLKKLIDLIVPEANDATFSLLPDNLE